MKIVFVVTIVQILLLKISAKSKSCTVRFNDKTLSTVCENDNLATVDLDILKQSLPVTSKSIEIYGYVTNENKEVPMSFSKDEVTFIVSVISNCINDQTSLCHIKLSDKVTSITFHIVKDDDRKGKISGIFMKESFHQQNLLNKLTIKFKVGKKIIKNRVHKISRRSIINNTRCGSPNIVSNSSKVFGCTKTGKNTFSQKSCDVSAAVLKKMPKGFVPVQCYTKKKQADCGLPDWFIKKYPNFQVVACKTVTGKNTFSNNQCNVPAAVLKKLPKGFVPVQCYKKKKQADCGLPDWFIKKYPNFQVVGCTTLTGTNTFSNNQCNVPAAVLKKMPKGFVPVQCYTKKKQADCGLPDWFIKKYPNFQVVACKTVTGKNTFSNNQCNVPAAVLKKLPKGFVPVQCYKKKKQADCGLPDWFIKKYPNFQVVGCTTLTGTNTFSLKNFKVLGRTVTGLHPQRILVNASMKKDTKIKNILRTVKSALKLI